MACLQAAPCGDQGGCGGGEGAAEGPRSSADQEDPGGQSQKEEEAAGEYASSLRAFGPDPAQMK